MMSLSFMINSSSPDLGAGPLAEQHRVTGLNVRFDPLAAFVAATWSNCNHLALHGLFFGSVGDDDATGALLVFVEPADHADHAKA